MKPLDFLQIKYWIFSQYAIYFFSSSKKGRIFFIFKGKWCITVLLTELLWLSFSQIKCWTFFTGQLFRKKRYFRKKKKNFGLEIIFEGKGAYYTKNYYNLVFPKLGIKYFFTCQFFQKRKSCIFQENREKSFLSAISIFKRISLSYFLKNGGGGFPRNREKSNLGWWCGSSEKYEFPPLVSLIWMQLFINHKQCDTCGRPQVSLVVMSISENFPYRYFPRKYGYVYRYFSKKTENWRMDTPAGALRSTLLSYHK